MKKENKKHSGFASDVFKLSTGSVISQIIPIITTPFLTRIYGPDSWGLLGLFISITAILEVIACMRYELSIMLPKEEEEAANMLTVSLIFSFIFFIINTIVISWKKDEIAALLNAQGLEPYLWLVPIYVLISGFFLALNNWNSRSKKYGRLSFARIISSASTVAGKFGFGYAGYATAGTLISTSVGGFGLATGILGWKIFREDRKFFIHTISWKRMITGISRYRNFPLISSWAALMNIISLQTPSLMLAFYFSPQVVGLYVLGNRILTRPMKFIGNSINQVFYQRAAAAANDGTIAELAEKTARLLTLITTFPLLLIAFLGPDIFSLIFGAQWREAGTYTQILVPWTMMVFISAPLASLNNVFEKQGVGLMFNILQLITRVASLIIGGVTGSIFTGLILFSISGVITVTWFLAYHLKLCGVNLRKFGKEIISIIGISTLFISPIYLIKNFVELSPLLLILCSIIIIISYYTFIILKNEELASFLKTKLKIFS